LKKWTSDGSFEMAPIVARPVLHIKRSSTPLIVKWFC